VEADGLSPVKPRSKLATVCGALNAAGARYVLIGGQAVILWGQVRTTRDIDVLIEATPENAERVLGGLADIGFILVRDLDAKDVASRPFTIIGDLWRVDLLTIAWSVRYPAARADATVFAIEGVDIPVASIPHLIESKRTGRLQDAADIEVLEQIQERRGG
jgi:hypothetical protein